MGTMGVRLRVLPQWWAAVVPLKIQIQHIISDSVHIIKLHSWIQQVSKTCFGSFPLYLHHSVTRWCYPPFHAGSVWELYKVSSACSLWSHEIMFTSGHSLRNKRVKTHTKKGSFALLYLFMFLVCCLLSYISSLCCLFYSLLWYFTSKMHSSVVLVINQAAGAEYHRFQTTFFNLKKAPRWDWKPHTTAPHRSICSCFFVVWKWVHWRRENNNNFSVQLSNIFSSSIQYKINASLWNSTPLHSQCYPPSQPPPPPLHLPTAPQTTHTTHTHSKWELTPSKGMVSYMRGPHFLLQPQPPQTKEAVSSFGN